MEHILGINIASLPILRPLFTRIFEAYIRTRSSGGVGGRWLAQRLLPTIKLSRKQSRITKIDINISTERELESGQCKNYLDGWSISAYADQNSAVFSIPHIHSSSVSNWGPSDIVEGRRTD